MPQEHPERTPAAWTKECLGILQRIDPAYRRNREATGRFIEFVRPDPSGLLVSQNFIRTLDSYHLCFALSFTAQRSFQLYTPLFAGSRFDHGRTIWRQFVDDVGVRRGEPGHPSGVWSFGPWRSNTMENLAKGFQVNEEFLRPFYRQALGAGKDRLVALFEAARRLVPALDPSLPAAALAASVGIDPALVERHPLGTASLDALKVARGGSWYVGFGPRTHTVNLDEIAPEVVVVQFAEAFLRERERLDEIVSIARAL
jgi:hypothetical protein